MGLDRVERDLLAGEIKSAGDRSQTAVAKGQTLLDIALGIGEIDRLSGVESLIDGQGYAVDATLHQSVNVQVSGVDVHLAHGEDGGRLGRITDGIEQ